MGLCLTIASSVHDGDYGNDDNVVYYGENNSESTNGGVRIGSIYSHQGNKGLNQDSAVLHEGYGSKGGALCAVFDGHGKNGHLVSRMVRNRLPTLLLSQRLALGRISASNSSNNETNKNLNKWNEACTSAFRVMDNEIRSLEKLDCFCSGAAAVVAIRQNDDLILANLGDSRAVLGTMTEDGIKAVPLTIDLKPSLASEALRIRRCNGRVFASSEEPQTQRVWLPYDDCPGLAMSRALGDFVLKRHGVISTPEISYHHLSPDDQFLVLATDGVWDVLSNDEVVSIVYEAESEDEAANAVVNASLGGWRDNFPTSRRDDSTVICLFLQKKQQISLAFDN